MKLTGQELFEKIDGLELTIRDLGMMCSGDGDTLDRAEQYLREYYGMLMTAKVEL